MENYDINAGRLVALSNMKDYKVAKDNPDLLGWRVVGADGEILGIVKDLIIDPKAMKVRYLSLVANRKFFNTTNDPYMLVPIGAAALDKSGKRVFVSSIDSKSISRYPLYNGGPITDDYEYAVRDNLLQTQREYLPGTTPDYKAELDDSLRQQSASPRHVSDDFYNNDTYNEDRFYAYDQDANRERMYPADQDVNRERANPARNYEEPDYSNFSAADVQNDVNTPKSVESAITTIEKLDNLRMRGAISDEEYFLLKRRALEL